MSKVAMKIFRKEEKVTKLINSSLWDLPSPSTMTYFWNFGSTLGLCLIIQIITGFLLTLHYTSYAEESFLSVIKIMREVWSGWALRFIHMNGASVFFLFIYLHLFRGMFYQSFTNKKIWSSGVTIMIMIMAISFLGYVLPWGQMSYWAVGVITSLFSIIPLIGTELIQWIWGGFAVSSPTLTRFYSLHFILPLILVIVVFIHLMFLHEKGSSNSMGMNSNLDKISFHPYFSVKDLIFITAIILGSMLISMHAPYMLGDAINNVPANPMQTPIHILPEWYFLPSYAILRALPTKTAGVMGLILSVAIFYMMTSFKMKFSVKFSFQRLFVFWTMIISFIFLMKMGASPAEEPYIMMSKTMSLIYFTSIIMLNI